mmetsp:Transcript_85164/g.241311  ORF Transcript_85164/g.241311 Transcript_85164/m.241311 type:complete len:223 (+) Transcript_85164:637-1305(+)
MRARRRRRGRSGWCRGGRVVDADARGHRGPQTVVGARVSRREKHGGRGGQVCRRVICRPCTFSASGRGRENKLCVGRRGLCRWLLHRCRRARGACLLSRSVRRLGVDRPTAPQAPPEIPGWSVSRGHAWGQPTLQAGQPAAWPRGGAAGHHGIQALAPGLHAPGATRTRAATGTALPTGPRLHCGRARGCGCGECRARRDGRLCWRRWRGRGEVGERGCRRV